jgi:hypothetical protein
MLHCPAQRPRPGPAARQLPGRAAAAVGAAPARALHSARRPDAASSCKAERSACCCCLRLSRTRIFPPGLLMARPSNVTPTHDTTPAAPPHLSTPARPPCTQGVCAGGLPAPWVGPVCRTRMLLFALDLRGSWCSATRSLLFVFAFCLPGGCAAGRRRSQHTSGAVRRAAVSTHNTIQSVCLLPDVRPRSGERGQSVMPGNQLVLHMICRLCTRFKSKTGPK